MNLKEELIKLGEEKPELRQDLSAVLDHLTEEQKKEAAGKSEEKKLRDLRKSMDRDLDTIDGAMQGLLAGQMRELDSKTKRRLEEAKRSAKSLSVSGQLMVDLLEKIEKGDL